MAQRRGTRVKNLSDALVEDACPLCSVLKDFQTCHLNELDRHEVDRLCGFHVWMVAKLADARSAAAVFLRIIARPFPQESPISACDACERIAQEERTRVKEFAASLNNPQFMRWLRDHGALCLPHAQKILSEVPKTAQSDIVLALSRRRSELTQKLTELLRQAGDKLPTQPGVLGRAAEYLVAQRGLRS